MEISFTVDASDLNRALGVASVVKPQATQGAGGYLFSVRGEECAVYSRDNLKHEARSSFQVSSVNGEGQFMFPADYVKAFAFVEGPIAFQATETNGSFKVHYTFEGSGSSERVSFDPRDMYNFEKDIQTAKDTVTPKRFSIKVLQFGLGIVKPFLPKKDDPIDQEFYNTVKIFGDNDPELAKANGYMIASNNKEICYFQCSAFLNKDLTAPSQHLGLIESFLSQSNGSVDIYTTDKKSYVINSNGDVLGWPKHSSEYTKFQYYSKTDEVVVTIDPATVLKRLKFMRSNLQADKNKIRMHFDPSDMSLYFTSVDEDTGNKSGYVTTTSVDVKVTTPFAVNVNVGHMIRMFEGVRGDRVEFRVKIFLADAKRPKDRYMFRTIDGFFLSDDGAVVGGIGAKVEGEAHECRVTRYAPSLD